MPLAAASCLPSGPPTIKPWAGRRIPRPPIEICLSCLPGRESHDLAARMRLIGVELTEDAVDLPSFHHPSQAAYVFGPERGSLSPEMQSRCDHMLKIPTPFASMFRWRRASSSTTVADSCRFAPKPVWAGAPASELPEHARGDQRFRADDAKRGKLRSIGKTRPIISPPRRKPGRGSGLNPGKTFKPGNLRPVS